MDLETNDPTMIDLWMSYVESLSDKNSDVINKEVARIALVYFAPMWKSTPTAGLEIILNQKPPHIKIQGVAIKSYI